VIEQDLAHRRDDTSRPKSLQSLPHRFDGTRLVKS